MKPLSSEILHIYRMWVNRDGDSWEIHGEGFPVDNPLAVGTDPDETVLAALRVLWEGGHLDNLNEFSEDDDGDIDGPGIWWYVEPRLLPERLLGLVEPDPLVLELEAIEDAVLADEGPPVHSDGGIYRSGKFYNPNYDGEPRFVGYVSDRNPDWVLLTKPEMERLWVLHSAPSTKFRTSLRSRYDGDSDSFLDIPDQVEYEHGEREQECYPGFDIDFGGEVLHVYCPDFCWTEDLGGREVGLTLSEQLEAVEHIRDSREQVCVRHLILGSEFGCVPEEKLAELFATDVNGIVRLANRGWREMNRRYDKVDFGFWDSVYGEIVTEDGGADEVELDPFGDDPPE